MTIDYFFTYYAGAIIVALIINFFLCVGVADFWNNKGHSYAGGFWYSLFFSAALGFTIGLLMPNVKPPVDNSPRL